MEKKMIVEDLEMSAPEKSFCRSLSLRAPDPSAQLSAAYRNKDIATFRELLSGDPPEVDPNHWYDDPNFATMLDLASRDDGREEYVHVLLSAGADPNRVNRVRKKAPLHLAAEAANIGSLHALLDCPKLDVNKQDNTGSTALHLAAKEEVGQTVGSAGRHDLEKRYRRCVELLMKHPDINSNKPNRKGLTPVHLAAQHATPDMIRLILSIGGSTLDVDSFQDAKGKSARDVMTEKHPQLVRLLPPRAGSDGEVTADILFFYLYSRESTNFVNALGSAADDTAILNADDGSHTLLQLACESGLMDVATVLVQSGADPNRTCTANRRPPLMLACYHGYYRIARLLSDDPRTDVGANIDGETALHAAVKGSVECLAASRAGQDHHKCVDILLRRGVDVNATDVKGNTVLHYATRGGDNDLVLTLMRSGAYIGVRNNLNEPPLADISPKALEAYLDECLGTNDLLPREDNYEVIFRYNFLAPRKGKQASNHVTLTVDDADLDLKQLVGARHGADPVASETDPLLYMSRSADLRYLLKHPIITSFLYLKWQRIRSFFYINLAFYIVFWVLLTAYILAGYSEHPGQLSPLPAPPTAPQNASAEATASASASGAPVVAALLGTFLLLLVLRELFQVVVSPQKYIASPENWMEVGLIVVTAVLLFSAQGQANTYSRQQLSAIAILLSWAELVLLIGRHPMLSTNIEMFKTVSLNFLKFLAWYSILIVAFALSFYTLFRDCGSTGCKTDDDENFFLSPGMSVFKSIVMLTGEFDAGSIPFVSFPGTSHILFVLFVFLIAIVLFNLLNGLAVSDTQAIREDAELVAYVSRVKLVAYVESMLVGEPSKSFHNRLLNFCCCLNVCHRLGCLRTLSARVNLFPDVIPDRQIHVLPNRSNLIEFTTTRHCSKNKDLDDEEFTGCVAKCREMRMDPTIMRDVKNLFLQHRQESETTHMRKIIGTYQQEVQRFAQKIDEYSKKFHHLERSSERTEEVLHQILHLLKNK